MSIELKINPERMGTEFETTGIYVRAKINDEKWDNADIMQLDRDSLISFMHSRGEKNTWAENIVLTLFGYEQYD
jgi:hypothetical protein